jgi:hypothetical protein
MMKYLISELRDAWNRGDYPIREPMIFWSGIIATAVMMGGIIGIKFILV